MKLVRTWLPLIIFLVIAVFLWRGLSLNPRLLPSVLLDKPAPDFVLSDLYVERPSVSTADLRGQISLFSVWATWCPSCSQEHDYKVQLAKRIDIPMIALNYKDDRRQAQQWLAQKGDPYQKIAFDEAGQVAIDWGVYGTPETYLIDAQGIIRYRHVGALNEKIWTREFMPRIKELQA